MKRFTLPKTDLVVSELCLGTADLGTPAARGADAERLVADFLEAGGTFFDTAHCYAFWVPGAGSGSSEHEVARCLRSLGASEDVVVATKGGHPPDGDRYPRSDDYLSPEVVSADIADSLERLGRERIDLFFLHRDDARVPVADVMETLNEEVRRGRVRYLGASNWPPERIEAANAYARARGLQGFVASEVQWSLAVPSAEEGKTDPTTRRVSDRAAEWYAASGISVLAYSANAGGYVAGNERANGLYDNPLSRARRERARAVAAEIGATPNQVALAWLRQQEPLTIPLFGTTKRDHLREALASVDVHLTPAQIAYLRATDALTVNARV